MSYTKERQNLPTVKGALQSQTVESLKKLAPLVSAAQKPTRKADLVEFILPYLQKSQLRALWKKLDKLQQAAVAETVHSTDSFYHPEQFIAKYGEAPNWGEREEGRYSWTHTLLALFFYNEVMPDDLKRAFKTFVPKPKTATLATQDDIPTILEQSWQVWDEKTKKYQTLDIKIPVVLCETERAACHELQAVLRLIEAGKLTVSDKTRFPTAVGIKAMNPILLGGDFYEEESKDEGIVPIKPFAWALLVQAGGLAELSGKRLQLTKSGQKALSVLPEKTIVSLWKRWLKTTLIDELRRVDCIKGQTGKGKRGLTAVAGRRQVINEALTSCPPGKWIDIDEFFCQMQATATFEVTRDPGHLYISDPNHGNLGYGGFGGWHILEARYSLCLLFEYAATLGLIDIAYISPHGAREDYGELWGTDDMVFISRYDGLLYFRLNPLGTYCLGLESKYAPAPLETKPVLKVLPNLEIVVTGNSLNPADTFLLDSYAKKISDAVWKLEQNRLLSALEAGSKISNLQEFLEARSGQKLPKTVAQLLTDINYRSCRLQDKGTARLIECAEATLAILIANDARTKPYCLLAGDRYLIIPVESETRFRSALRKLGYSFPK